MKRSNITSITEGKKIKTSNILEEFDSADHEWVWDKKSFIDIPYCLLSRVSLTMIRGNKPLEKGRHHFWEIQIMSRPGSKFVTIGVGTAKAVEAAKATTHILEPNHFLLGHDCESWGLSSTGFLYHDSKKYEYGQSFRSGNNIIRIHLNTWTGTLQFSHNGKPLGIAFRNLNNVTLYPLISTITISYRIKLTYSISMPVSLQSACLEVLTLSQKKILWEKFPNLYRLCQFANMLQN